MTSKDVLTAGLMFKQHLKNELVWLPEIGMGYYPVRDTVAPYDSDYFEEYRRRADTRMGRLLTQYRQDVVAAHYDGPLIDVGVGSGQFLESRPGTWGYDINPVAVGWLKERGTYSDLYGRRYRAATFWDSLEHIQNPYAALEQVQTWAFISIPIFEDASHCLGSRHFRRDEHLWYFEDRGIRTFMKEAGFECITSDDGETRLGREGIGTYAFKRVRNG